MKKNLGIVNFVVFLFFLGQQTPLLTLHPETIIKTATESTPLALLQPGQMLTSFDETREETVTQPVVSTTSYTTSNAYRINFETESVIADRYQKFYVAKKDFILASELQQGDMLATSSGKNITIESITKINKEVPVVTIEVDATHTFFCTSLELIAHNSTFIAQILPLAEQGALFLGRHAIKIVGVAVVACEAAGQFIKKIITSEEPPIITPKRVEIPEKIGKAEQPSQATKKEDTPPTETVGMVKVTFQPEVPFNEFDATELSYAVIGTATTQDIAKLKAIAIQLQNEHKMAFAPQLIWIEAIEKEEDCNRKKKCRYVKSSYHHINSRGKKSPEPRDGQQSLDESLPVDNDVPPLVRIAVQGKDEFVILRRTMKHPECLYKGYVVGWEDLTQEQKNVIIRNKLATFNGKLF